MSIMPINNNTNWDRNNVFAFRECTVHHTGNNTVKCINNNYRKKAQTSQHVLIKQKHDAFEILLIN